MRAWLIGLTVCCAVWWAGCSGGGDARPQQVDAGLVGTWLDATPSPPLDREAEGTGAWPTRTLLFTDAGTYRYEVGSSARWERGRYRVADGQITFIPEDGAGAVTPIPGHAAAYVWLDAHHLGLSDLEGTTSLRLSRVVSTMPPVLVGEWALALRYAADNLQLPCVESVTLRLAADGTLTLNGFHPLNGWRTATEGTVLISVDGAIALRLPGSDGLVGVLGVASVSDGVISCRRPDGARSIFALRTVPETRLLTRWRLDTAEGVTLALRSDGTYTHTTPATTESGTWRTYRGKYLVLTTVASQRTYLWQLWGQAPQLSLAFAGWTCLEDGTPQYAELVWRQLSE